MYRKNTYKFGNRTLSEISSISSSELEIGDSVFNTTWKIPEFWTGTVWTNEHCVVAISSSYIDIGKPCQWFNDITFGVRIELASTSSKYRFAGICLRSINVGPVHVNVIAIKGRFPVRFTSTVSRGDYYTLSGTGAVSNGSSSAAGTIGRVLENKTYSGTPIEASCYINGIEKY